MIKRINAPVMRAAMPSREAPLAAVAMASPITSGPLHLRIHVSWGSVRRDQRH